MSMPVKEILQLADRRLKDAGVADHSRDSKSLYCWLMHIPESRLILEYQNIIQDLNCEKYFSLIDRRAAGEPLQYIIESQAFMGLTFSVSPDVLIPRQDTESLVEYALDKVKARAKGTWEILDLGCGSGAIGISMARLFSRSRVTCADIRPEALVKAKENAEQNGLSGKIKFVESDMFQAFQKKWRDLKFDLILSNPPYIPTAVIPTLQREIRDHEPLSALDGGEDGLDFYRIIAKDAPRHLRAGGLLILEIGFDQREAVSHLLEEGGYFEEIESARDLAGLDRIVKAKRKGKR